EVTKDIKEKYGPVKPVMQNTVMIGAIAYLSNLGLEEPSNVLKDTFAHKGQEVIDQNIALLTAGYEYAKANAKEITGEWEFSRKGRPSIAGNEASALAAYAAGCRVYSACPMTPGSTILDWMAANQKETGVLVKQWEDELSVV